MKVYNDAKQSFIDTAQTSTFRSGYAIGDELERLQTRRL